MKTLCFASVSALGLMLLSCQQQDPSSACFPSEDNPNIAWVKETNFKVDFEEDMAESIKTVEDKRLVDFFLDAAESGRLKAYDPLDNSEWTVAQVRDYGRSTDTVVTYDPETGDPDTAVHQVKLFRHNVTKMRVKQKWYLDTADFKLKTKVIAVMPMHTRTTRSGAFLGDFPMYWLYLEGEPELITDFNELP